MTQRKKLIDFFEEKFEANQHGRSPQKAFEATIQEVGFDAYESYRSYSVSLKHRKKSRK